MSFSFPSNPSLNQQSTQNGRLYQWNGYAWDLVGNVAGHASTHASGGSDALTISSSQISNFNTSVSGLVNGFYAPLSGATFTGNITAPSGNFSNNLQVGSTSLTTNDVLNIINSTNLYLWSNFR